MSIFVLGDNLRNNLMPRLPDLARKTPGQHLLQSAVTRDFQLDRF
ncbi:MAG: hypothetical protein ACREDR_01840 [Blastocatellia bacterium]